MATAKNPITVCEAFGITEADFHRLGVLNSTLAIDTRLFIDPALLRSSQHPEMQAAAAEYSVHFERVIQLLAASQVADDPAWRAAQRMLSFPEVAGTCLGYGAGSINGRSFGRALSARLVSVAAQIVEIGIRDPDLFSSMALFEDDVGPDLISDMTTNVIFASLGRFNERILDALGLAGEHFERGGVRYRFLVNPFQQRRTPVVLVPTDILRELPVAADWDGIALVSSQNEQLRNEVNRNVAHVWERKTKRDKATLKDQVLGSKEAFETLLTAIKTVAGTPYDVNSDPESLVQWASKGKAYAEQHPLVLRAARTSDEVFAIVSEIVRQFRHLIENCGLNRELYRTSTGDPQHESTAQRLFFAVAYSYCKANDVDVSPEIDVGTGKIDFKMSAGFKSRVLVEIKLSTNTQVVRGFTSQLELYRKAQETTKAIYLVIDVGSMGKKDEALVALRNEAQNAGNPISDLEFVDGTLKLPPSKRR